ncbi:hypothetical protein [Mycolicibacterium sp. CBMA 226]|uniref:hypothetical protein n=1 Tax=Mycolicibacterium sp. CBMA 226 TaxID=2606611 RepID=UPI0012DEDDD5|nr:hypothetical protein [Mycolicibacterium sp. CBMA 226]MUL78844.1 hypothetical protein [Mycolicibacterium sp. CBMA 226]QGW61141.1 hypothetical protein ICEMyc226_00109 [Mycolicibacterium sp.]
MIRPVAQHLANNPGIAQHLAGTIGGDAPMRLRHTIHLLTHGVHDGWLTAFFVLLIISLPFIIALIGIIYRRTQQRSAQPTPAYRPVSVAPWQAGTITPPAAPWQSGMGSSAAMQPHYPPTYTPAPIASATPAVPTWSAPQANQWAAPAPQWSR